jgi:hypothetical protein
VGSIPIRRTVMNQIEIERKWLMMGYPQCSSTLDQVSTTMMEQIYTPDGFRYRQEIRDWRVGGAEQYKYYKLRKEKVSDGVYNELDIQEITSNEYHVVKEARPHYPKISKRRTVYKAKGSSLKFEFDVYLDMELAILEVELPSLDHVIEFHPNIEKQIIMEVTGMEQFSNKFLAIKLNIPYVG